jgi:nickel/cobalt transporter (NiCoT) family protein
MIDLPTTDLPTTFGALALLAFALGMRHGFDADHLAAIDGLTRLHRVRAPRAARWCGALFSVGHGGVVAVVVLALSQWPTLWQPPTWLQGTGLAVSLAFLFALGVLNLQAALSPPTGPMPRPAGLRARWLRHVPHAGHPLGSLLVGALFALSFDTLSQAALLAVGGRSVGPSFAMLLALLFMAGMLVTDGINGWWMARLLARADAVAARASRVMSGAVAVVSLLVAALGLARWTLPLFDDWAAVRDGLFGALVVLVLAVSYMLAMWRARRAVASTSTSA